MSDDCKCDGCGKHGRRKRFTLAPEGWFYAEIKMEDPPDHCVVLACSEACKLTVWKPGPGKIETLTEEQMARLHPRSVEDDVWLIYDWTKEVYLKGHQYTTRDEAWNGIQEICERGYV